MAKRENGSAVDFITKRCRICGRFGDKVYRHKRNGEPWVYDYVYKPKYLPTVLSRRFESIIRKALKITNPQKAGYETIINKFFYYTPYFVYAGNYNFTCESFFKIKRARNYLIEINEIKLNLHLAKRSHFSLLCEPGKNYQVNCIIDGRLYSSRKVIVIEPEVDLEQVYHEWLTEHLLEILEAPDPQFRCIKLYHRGIVPPAWINSFWGRTDEGIVYRSYKFKRFMYTRKPYEHVHNPSTDHFYLSQKQITSCWSEAAKNFKQVLKKYCWRWFDDNYKQTEKIVKVHNLWSKLIFRAGKVLSFDLEDISPSNWLPGIETLGELLKLCGYGNYSLTSAELSTRIF